jgi:hypothetical protein
MIKGIDDRGSVGEHGVFIARQRFFSMLRTLITVWCNIFVNEQSAWQDMCLARQEAKRAEKELHQVAEAFVTSNAPGLSGQLKDAIECFENKNKVYHKACQVLHCIEQWRRIGPGS